MIQLISKYFQCESKIYKQTPTQELNMATLCLNPPSPESCTLQVNYTG